MRSIVIRFVPKRPQTRRAPRYVHGLAGTPQGVRVPNDGHLWQNSYYPFQFLMRSTASAVPCLLYHFRSTRTRRLYIVCVEEYPDHFYGIKFYLKDDAHSPFKYNRLTGLNEKRFRVYRRILTSYFSQNVFEHYQITQQSAYAMVRKLELAARPDLIEQISMYFSDNYTNFD